GNTNVAGICDGASGPDREALNHRDTGYAQAFQPLDKAVELHLVRHAIIPAGELAELRNVGPRDKSLAAGAAKHSDADTAIFIDRATGRGETVVHSHGSLYSPDIPRRRTKRLWWHEAATRPSW